MTTSTIKTSHLINGLRSCVLLSLLIVCAGCGNDNGESSGPTPLPGPASVNLTGTWHGTVNYTAGEQIGQESFDMTLNQTDGTVSGSYSAQLFDGDISGQVTTSTFSGTLDFNFTSQGVTCVGELQVSGPVSTNTIAWTSPNMGSFGSCVNTPVQFSIAASK